MVCRHSDGDRSCTTRYPRYDPPDPPKTPDASNYSIEDVMRVGRHLVMKVKYPNCSSCAFEGTKILVFLNISELEALKWRKIDPHFRDPRRKSTTEAPSPAARFPGTPEGWADAVAYANSKESK